MSFIPGYLGTVTINSQDISATGSVVRLALSRTVMTKPVFGSAWGKSLGGQSLGAFSASGHVDTEKVAALNTMFSTGAVTFSLQVGQADAATDGGLYSGTCVISNFTIEANADGEWDWSIEAQTDGTVTYAPAAEESSSSSSSSS